MGKSASGKTLWLSRCVRAAWAVCVSSSVVSSKAIREMASRNHLKIEQTEAAPLSININGPDITQFEAEARAD